MLYRKYRSLKLSELVGQDHIATTLSAAIKKGAIAHAYLLTGPRGVGKTSVARILAHEFNQIEYLPDKHQLDIIEIDAASNRRIDEVRELRETINLVPTSLKYKVYIIDEVHMLTREAFNALLKTLEEPPDHAIFILATTEFHKVPETIVSRCQRFTFKQIAAEVIVGHIKQIAKLEKITIDQAALEIIANHSHGSFRDGLSLLDQLGSLGIKIDGAIARNLIGLATDTKVRSLLKAYRSHDLKQIITEYRQLVSQGTDAVVLADQLAEILREELPKSPDQATDLELLEALLELANARQPEALMEVALLKNHQPQPTKQSATTTPAESKAEAQPAEPKVSSQPPKAPTKPVAKATPKPKAPAKAKTPTKAKTTKAKPASQPKTTKPQAGKAQSLSITDWPKVLEAIKARSKTLYGVLRIAKLEIQPEQLKLSFEFPFHCRIFNTKTNRKILEDVLDGLKLTYGQLEIEQTEDQPKLMPQTAAETEPDDPDKPTSDGNQEVSQAIDIFGGGQIVGGDGA